MEAKAAVPKPSGSTASGSVAGGDPRADRSGGGGVGRKLFVGGTGDVDDAEFRAHFAAFGVIEDCVLLRKVRGVGVV